MVPERRSSPRVPTYQPIRLQKSGAPSVVETLTKDLSAGGVRCLSMTLFPVSSDLSVELVLTAGEELLSVSGRAVWFRMIPHSDQFDVGISFESLTERNKRRLSAYLERIAERIPPTVSV